MIAIAIGTSMHPEFTPPHCLAYKQTNLYVCMQARSESARQKPCLHGHCEPQVSQQVGSNSAHSLAWKLSRLTSCFQECAISGVGKFCHNHSSCHRPKVGSELHCSQTSPPSPDRMRLITSCVPVGIGSEFPLLLHNRGEPDVVSSHATSKVLSRSDPRAIRATENF